MTDLRAIARSIFLGALGDCSVERAMARTVSEHDAQLHLCGEHFDPRKVRRLRIIAAGKAAATMLTALLRHLPIKPEWDRRGVLIAPEPPPALPPDFRYFCGGHPMPNQTSFAGARAALELLRSIATEETASTLCIFLLSGGASAMMELPLDPSIGLGDTQAFHCALVGSGASITEINCVRKHFSAVKGGRLALAAGNSACVTMFISDVPAGQEDAIGSGPTVADTSTLEECREILTRYHLLPQFPGPVRAFFESAAFKETPRELKSNVRSCVLLHADDLAEAAARRAMDLGWPVVVDHTSDEWPYDKAADYLLQRLRELRHQSSRVCLIAGGEVLVQLPAGDALGSIGSGGRNQQFALYAATRLTAGDPPVAILSAGSDGIDGNSAAAGAVVDGTLLQAADTHLLAMRALQGFDAYPFLASRGALLVTGVTGNNLRDLRLLMSA